MTAVSEALRPGEMIRIRGERWTVVRRHPYEQCAVLEVAGADVSNRGTSAHYLLPFDRLERGSITSELPRVVRPSALRLAVRDALVSATPSWTSLRSPVTARLSLLPFQLEPALAVAGGLATRVLLADEVGLGKTIQAALIVAEVRAREPDARVLIVTPAGLREQWRDELLDRFDIDCTLLDAGRLARTTAQIPAGVNPWGLPRTVIASIDFVKRPDVIRSLETLVWDVVIFDEAHGLAGRSDRSAAAGLLAARSSRVILLTATPHSGDDESFARLCSLGSLDGDNHPLMMFRRGRAAAGSALRRRSRLLAVTPTDRERTMLDALHRYARAVRRHAPREHAAGARLVMGVLARRACSSASSLARSVERRLSLLAGEPPRIDTQLHLPLDDGPGDGDREPVAELGSPGLADADAERAVLHRLLALARAASHRESKIGALRRLLRRCHEPAIVFTEYRDTLAHLASALAAGNAATLHGDLDAAERRRQIRRFTHGDAHLLLATDAASEGLNLHHRCRIVINLEMPWTPTRFEQRAGRVDRLGQTRLPHIITLAARDTFEDGVVARFARRRTRAQAAAPFSARWSAAAPGMPVAVDLRNEADVEARRLAQLVAMRDRGYPRAEGRRHRVGPPAALLSRSPGCLLWALALYFLDERGAPVWESIVGLRASGNVAAASHGALQAALRSMTAAAAPALMRLAIQTHEAHLARLAAELRDATAAGLSRARAIEHALHRDRARLARPLLQPGLFDRRLGDGHVEDLPADAAIAAVRERLADLERLRNVRAGERTLLFLAATR